MFSGFCVCDCDCLGFLLLECLVLRSGFMVPWVVVGFVWRIFLGRFWWVFALSTLG